MLRDDKEEIHLIYVSSDISDRQLAARYNLSPTTLRKWRREGLWDLERKEFARKAADEAQRRLDEGLTQALSSATDRMEAILRATDKLLNKVRQLLELEDALAPRDLKSLSSTMLDIMQMQTMSQQGEGEADNTWTINIGGVEDA